MSSARIEKQAVMADLIAVDKYKYSELKDCTCLHYLGSF